MVRRKRKVKKISINYKILTYDLYESICKNPSMSELLGDFKHLGYRYGLYFLMFDKSDPKVYKKIWKMHKEEVMNRWRSDPRANAGKRPYLWWRIEAPELRKRLGNKKETEYHYLKRLNLLEDWEIKEYKRLREVREVFGEGNIYEKEWEY